MRITLVRDHIDELIHYIKPLLPLANFHMVDYFTGKDPLTFFFSQSLITEIKNFGIENTLNSIFNEDYIGLQHLENYVRSSQKFCLKNCSKVCFTLEDLEEKVLEIDHKKLSQLKMNIFMNSKKSHEVEVLSSICAKIHLATGTSHIIDIGDGKGYLSSFLALHYKIPVLGVDASQTNTEGAVKRVQKLSRVWNSIANDEKSTRPSSDLYKQITMFVDNKVDVEQLVSNVFLETPSSIGLVGLHTCGNLSATSLQIFIANENVKTLCNVGCCYHFITEKYEKGSTLNQYGFPLSKHLHNENFVIGRAARMIAAQSIERILHKKELPNKTLFFRSLYEILLNRKFPLLESSQKQVGRFRKDCPNFVQYVHNASKRLGLDLDVTDEEIIELYQEFKEKQHEVNLFYMLRSLLSSAIESLILLDRLLFLLENDYEQSFLVQLFDPVISPRCYGLIAIK